MPEKADIYFDAISEAETLEAKVDALEATIVDLEAKKDLGKLSPADERLLGRSVEKLSELKADEAKYLQIAKEAVKASRPSVAAATDYSDAPLYSQTLRKYLRLETASSQYIFYASFVASSFYAGRGLFRAYHLMKAAETINNPKVQFKHMFYANATPLAVEHADLLSKQFASKGMAAGLGVPVLYAAWFVANHLKNRSR